MIQLAIVVAEARFALRALLRNPGFTLVVVLLLAFCLALAAATMSVFNAYLLTSMPYPAADRLYHVIYAPQGQPEPRGMTSIDWPSLGDVVEVADSSIGARFYLAGNGYTQEALGMQVAFGSVEALGVRAVMGRSLEQSDFRPESDQVALISHSLWRNRFGQAPNVLGQVFRASLNDQADVAETFRIVGVLPPDFRDVRNYGRGLTEIVVPLRSPMRTYAIRLREGVPLSLAEQRITEAAKSVAVTLPADWGGVKLESVHDRYVHGLRPVLTAIMVAVGLVLVIVTANVAVLTMLRTARRRSEFSVRVALGASRIQMFRLLMMESGLICVAALAASVSLTALVLRFLGPVIEQQMGRPPLGGASTISVDTNVLLAVGLAGVLIAFVLPIIPAWTTGNPHVEHLRRDGRTGARARSVLVALEVAGSFALLVGCGLMVRSATNLLQTDLGYETSRILRSRVALPMRNYPDAAALERFYRQFMERLSVDPGSQAALTNWPPFYEAPLQPVETEGHESPGLEAGVVAVSPDYFSLMGIPVRNGRGFVATDAPGAEPVAVISETLARRLWPTGNAIGRQIRTAEQPVPRSRLAAWRTIVGVVRDVRQTFVDADASDIYIPFFQAPSQYAPLMIKTDLPASFWLARLRSVASDLDSGVLVNELTPLQSEGDRLTAGTRFLTSVLSGFALFAGLLVVLGMYGVTGYAAQQRQREVAIRIAVGATRNAIVQMFLKQGAIVLVAGCACGLVAAVALARVLSSQLYGVDPLDLTTLVVMGMLLALAALSAVWWPAKRAAMKNPMSALKEI